MGPALTYSVQAPCPCWTEEQIARVGLQGRETNYCIDQDYWDLWGYDSDSVRDVQDNYPVDIESTHAWAVFYNPAIHPWVPNDGHLCNWLDYWYSWELGDYIFVDVVSLWLTPEEYAACLSSVENQAAAAGLVC